MYVGCTQPRSGDSWFERTGRGAHWYARTTETGSCQHCVDETVAGGSSHTWSAEQISGSDTFHPTQDAKSRFCVGRPVFGRWWSTCVSVTERSCNETGFFLHGGGHASSDVTLFGCHPERTVGDLRLFLGMRHPHDLVDFFQCSEGLKDDFRALMIARSSLSCTSTLMVLRFSRSLGPARLSRLVGPRFFSTLIPWECVLSWVL